MPSNISAKASRLEVRSEPPSGRGGQADLGMSGRRQTLLTIAQKLHNRRHINGLHATPEPNLEPSAQFPCHPGRPKLLNEP